MVKSKEESDASQTRSCLQSTNIKSCWIYQKEKTDGKERRRKKKFTNCENVQAGDTLLEAAKIRKDRRLIVALGDQDPVAIEVCYHKTCYRHYTDLKQMNVNQTGQKKILNVSMMQLSKN